MPGQTAKIPGKSNFFQTYSEAGASQLIGIEGYVGDEGAGTVKLHNPLNPSTFIEIPRDAIRKAKASVNDEGFETVVFHLPMNSRVSLAGMIDLSLAEVLLHASSLSRGGCSCGEKGEAKPRTTAQQIGPGGGGWGDFCGFLCFGNIELCKWGAGSNPVRWIWCYIDAIICLILCIGRGGPTFPIP
jgi:hypothetical protein